MNPISRRERSAIIGVAFRIAKKYRLQRLRGFSRYQNNNSLRARPPTAAPYYSPLVDPRTGDVKIPSSAVVAVTRGNLKVVVPRIVVDVSGGQGEEEDDDCIPVYEHLRGEGRPPVVYVKAKRNRSGSGSGDGMQQVAGGMEPALQVFPPPPPSCEEKEEGEIDEDEEVEVEEGEVDVEGEPDGGTN